MKERIKMVKLKKWKPELARLERDLREFLRKKGYSDKQIDNWIYGEPNIARDILEFFMEHEKLRLEEIKRFYKPI